MTAQLISVSQCVAISGLAADELILGVTPSKLHDRLYDSYLRNRSRPLEALPDRIVRDIRSCVALGAMKPAADLLIVLRKALSRRPRQEEGACARSALEARSGVIGRSRKRARRPTNRAKFVSLPMVPDKFSAAHDNVLSLEAYRHRMSSLIV